MKYKNIQNYIMKTKIIPFDIELAKKIQSGEVEGRIKTKGDFNVRIVSFDMDNESYQIVAIIRDTIAKNQEYSRTYTKDGYRYCSRTPVMDDLVLEVPDTDAKKHEFKPFDKVLVRDDCDMSSWKPSLFVKHYPCAMDGKEYFETIGEHFYELCIPYEGNEYLVGTTNKPE